MAIVRKFIKAKEPLTKEDKIRLRALRDRPVFYDKDCPELTDEQLREFKPVNPELPRPKRPAWDNKPVIAIKIY